jgi:hypothetical protein
MALLNTVYLTLAYLFGGLLILSFIVGEIVEWVGDGIEFLGDIAEWLVELLPWVDSVELTGDLQWGHGSDSVAVSRGALSFLTVFGGLGHFSLNVLHMGIFSLGVALVGGLVAGFVTFHVIRLIFPSTSLSLLESGYVNRVGTVTVAIDPGKKGQISVTTDGGLESLTATSRSSQTIPRYTRVVVVSMQGGVALVEEATDKQILTH